MSSPVDNTGCIFGRPILEDYALRAAGERGQRASASGCACAGEQQQSSSFYEAGSGLCDFTQFHTLC